MNWNKYHLGFPALLGLWIFACGCEKKVEPPAGAATAFASAKPEVQQIWNAGVAAAQKNDYLGATSNLMALRVQSASMSPEQVAALEDLWANLGVKTFAAAEKNDPGAVAAMLYLRQIKPR